VLADSSASSACCGRHSTSCRCGSPSSPNQVGAASRFEVRRKSQKSAPAISSATRFPPAPATSSRALRAGGRAMQGRNVWDFGGWKNGPPSHERIRRTSHKRAFIPKTTWRYSPARGQVECATGGGGGADKEAGRRGLTVDFGGVGGEAGVGAGVGAATEGRKACQLARRPPILAAFLHMLQT